MAALLVSRPPTWMGWSARGTLLFGRRMKYSLSTFTSRNVSFCLQSANIFDQFPGINKESPAVLSFKNKSKE